MMAPLHSSLVTERDSISKKTKQKRTNKNKAKQKTIGSLVILEGFILGTGEDVKIEQVREKE